MNLDWQIILGVLSLIVAATGAGVAIRNAQTSAKKTEVDNQSRIIGDLEIAYRRLSAENISLRNALKALEMKYTNVCAWATERGYTVPAVLQDA